MALPSALDAEHNQNSLVIHAPLKSNSDKPRDPNSVLDGHEKAIAALEGTIEEINDYMVSNRGNIEKFQLRITELREHLDTAEGALGKLKSWEFDHKARLSEYKEEIERRKKKMTAIRNALNVDWDSLLG